MMLEGLAPSCWSDPFVLKLDGRPWGEFRPRGFARAVEIHCRRLRFEMVGWLENRLVLTDTADGRILAEAERRDLLPRAWKLRLSNGSAGWFRRADSTPASGWSGAAGPWRRSTG
jgi:hypothetical protein